VKQGVLTVVAEIAEGRADELVGLLDALDAALDGEGGVPIVDFRQMDTVHFARFAVLPADSQGRQHLMFSTAYDGPRPLHLTELARRLRSGLCTLYSHCVAFPEDAQTSPGTFVAYLEDHEVPYGAMHVGYVGRTVKDIRDEAALRAFLEGVLDAKGGAHWNGRSARSVRAELISAVKGSELAPLLEARAAEIARATVEGWW
jgi:hypothetical protein